MDTLHMKSCCCLAHESDVRKLEREVTELSTERIHAVACRDAALNDLAAAREILRLRSEVERVKLEAEQNAVNLRAHAEAMAREITELADYQHNWEGGCSCTLCLARDAYRRDYPEPP
ncbi:MAG: hypothetical protein A2Y38_04625 [Spirochaetes bacterium GWB1_59_5]|nr:MAG: hypothetical protein A2Y38_04625 [Spirochaetes bacterium GWB1_59_5]